MWVDLGIAAALALGVLLRFWATSPLWLDEALTVNIAKLPINEIPEALRHDGAPPLFYALLHGWMRLLGESDFAVRSLSGAFAALTLPLAYLAGRRLAGREGGWTALVLMAASPFALRYATEARMYALVTFLTALGFLALDSFLRRPTTPRLAATMFVSGALVLTHYWAFFFLGAITIGLAIRADRTRQRFAPSWAIVGIVTGSLAFVPWLPSFIYQTQHTGTPWARPPRLSSIIGTFFSFGGVGGEWSALLGPVLLAFAVLGSIGVRYDHRRVLLDLRGARPGRGLWGVAVGTLFLAVIAGLVTGAGFAPRYASVVLLPAVLLVMLGTQAVANPTVRHGLVAGLCALGLAAAGTTAGDKRTQAGQVAAVLNARAQPNDVVVYCPDQLGPAVDRLLTVPVRQVTFPRYRGPQRVDWVDYAQAIKRTKPAEFASVIHRGAGDRPIWLVWSPGYRPFLGRCEQLDEQFDNVRTVRHVFVYLRASVGSEHEYLIRYSVPATTTTTTSTTIERRSRQRP